MARQRAVVEAFLAASRDGDLGRLVAVPDPDVVLRADAAAVATGAAASTVGADAVAATFVGRAQGARAALVDGAVALVWSVGGTPKVGFDLVIGDDHILEIDLVADTGRLSRFDIEPIPA